MGVSERVLWHHVRKERLGYKCRRQVAVGSYIVDFYFPDASLAVEIDGEHHENQRDYDARRDSWLRSRGIEVIRIPSLDLFEGTGEKFDAWLKLIVQTCKERTSS